MKKLIVILITLFSLAVFAEGYKVYFKNGGFMVLKQKPDFSKEKVVGILPDGNKILFSKSQVDFERTEKANSPKKEVKPKKSEKKQDISKKSNPFVSAKKSATAKKPLIITEQTVGRKTNNKGSNTKASSKKKKLKPSNPFQNWMKEESKEIPSDNPGIINDAPPSNSAGADEKAMELYWRTKFTEVNNAIKETEQKLKAVSEQLNRLMTEKLNTDDTIYIMRINKQMNELEKKKKELQKQLSDLKAEKENLKESARKAGALPGWYRDLI